MKTKTQKYQELEKEVAVKIEKLIKKKGVESEHITDLVLKIQDDQMFNLEGGRYLTEITSKILIDNNGYSYNHSCLTLEQLCEIADSFL